MVKDKIYLNRWLKILDIILEKRKERVLGKLRTIQLIKEDSQLLMRIFVRGRNDVKIESDQQLSQFNYRSRQNYSIDIAILEKG